MGYRMIIADDEEMLIQLIKKLGHFEALGIEIVDTCHDGEEAYRSILEHRPDFVLTDIQMPAMDGLEMIEKVQRVAPEILFVLLSGYRYFEYARSAVQLNAVDYLLKPVDEEQLNALLARLCRMIDERRRQQSDRETLKSLRDSAAQARAGRFWDMLIASMELWSPAAFQPEALEREYGLSFKKPLFRLLIAQVNATRPPASGARLSFEQKLDELSEAAFRGKAEYLSCHRDGRYYALLNFDEAGVSAMRSAVSAFFYACRELREVFGEFRLTVGLSENKSAASSLPEAALEASAAVWGRLYFVGDQLIRSDQVSGMERVPPSALLPDALRRRIGDDVRYLRRDDLAAAFAELKQALREHPYIYPGDLGRFFEALRDCAASGATDEGREGLRSALDGVARSARDPMQLLQHAYLELERYVSEQAAALEQANRRPARLAVEYIHRHYAEAISLESAAEAAGVSPAYLSKLFKELQGAGFSEYLTNLRLDESKRLLSDTGMSIREVAGAVGYQDEKYYSKLFKKQFGIKPTDYRKLYG